MQVHNARQNGASLAEPQDSMVLTADQQIALEQARGIPLPVWKRTRLDGLEVDALYPTFGAVEIQVPATPGLYVADLQTALREKPELVAKYRGKAVADDKNKFIAYNAALARDGVVIYVPRNVEVTEPIRVTYRVPQAGAAIFPRTLVVAEANSHVTVIEEFTSGPLDKEALVIPVSEIWANDGAHVRFMSLQTLDPHASLIGAQTAILDRDANIFWMSGAVGADVQHVDMAVRLTGNGSALDWLGFTFATGKQNLLWAPTVNHVGLSTTAQITWKSAVADTGYAIFDGMIKIDHSAQGTVSDLRDSVLHLSPAARSDSIPGLEIDANEVKAGHGSTSGQVDEEQLFYLQARGLNRREALRMIVLGFFASVVERVPLEDVRDRVLELIDGKL